MVGVIRGVIWGMHSSGLCEITWFAIRIHCIDYEQESS